jgi:hypothetical protein
MRVAYASVDAGSAAHADVKSGPTIGPRGRN